MRRRYRKLLSERLLINLRSGEAIRGHLIREEPKDLILQNAELLLPKPGTPPAPIDGEQWIPLESVKFISRLDGDRLGFEAGS